MAFIDDVIEKAQKAGKIVIEKAGDAKEYVTLEYKASTIRNQTDGLYRELGRLIYTSLQSDENVDDKKQVLIDRINELIAQQNEINAQITKFKNICTSCGAANSSKADFCAKCGKSLR